MKLQITYIGSGDDHDRYKAEERLLVELSFLGFDYEVIEE